MSGTPDREVAEESVVHVRWQGPLPWLAVGRIRLPSVLGGVLDELLDPVGEPV